MATVKTYPYVIYYKDSTFQTLDLTKADYTALETAMMESREVAKVTIGVMRVDEIRSIFERIEPVKQQDPEPEEAYPNMSMEDHAWIVMEAMRIEAENAKRRMEVDYATN